MTNQMPTGCLDGGNSRAVSQHRATKQKERKPLVSSLLMTLRRARTGIAYAKLKELGHFGKNSRFSNTRYAVRSSELLRREILMPVNYHTTYRRS